MNASVKYQKNVQAAALRTGFKKKKRKKLDLLDIIIYTVLTLLAVSIIIPIYHVILVSLASNRTYMTNPGMMFLKPSDITLINYKYIFESPILATGYKSTLFITVLGTVYGMSITLLAAYALSRPAYPGKKLFFVLFILIPMYFGGGMIPAYLNLRDLGLLNKQITIVIMMGVSGFNMLIIKSNIEQMPEGLLEAARLDGASELVIFVRIVLPLQLPIIATFSLFTAVGYWNEWFWPMMVLDKSEQWPLPLVLRAVVNSGIGNFQDAASESMQSYKNLQDSVSATGTTMATLFMTMLPIMVTYPFLQKYFVKGTLVGAIKM